MIKENTTSTASTSAITHHHPLPFHFEKISYCVVTLAVLWAAAGQMSVFYDRQIALVFVLALLSGAYYSINKDLSFLQDRLPQAWKGAVGGIAAGLASILVVSVLPVPTHILEELTQVNYLGLTMFILLVIPMWEVQSRHILTPLWGVASVAFLDSVLLGVGTQNIAIFLITLITCTSSAYLTEKFGFASGVISRVISTLMALMFLAFAAL